MNRTQMLAVIAAGGSVIYKGKLFSKSSQVPAQVDLDLDTVEDAAAATKTIHDLSLGSPDVAATGDLHAGIALTGSIQTNIAATHSPKDSGAEFGRNIVLNGSVAGTAQVETGTVIGTIGSSGQGNAKVIVTGAGITGSPVTVPVAVANNDTASQVGGKCRTAVGLNAAITALYDVGGSGADITLTRKTLAANDATLNIRIDNDTCSGLTNAPTSADTTPGVLKTQGTVTAHSINPEGETVSEDFTIDGTSAVVGSKVHYGTLKFNLPAGNGNIVAKNGTKIGMGRVFTENCCFMVLFNGVRNANGVTAFHFDSDEKEKNYIDSSELDSVTLDGSPLDVWYVG